MMLLQVWRQIVAGVAWGGFITFIALTILVLTDTEAPVTQIWLYMGGSLFLGIYFGLAGFIFVMDEWSPLKKTTIHLILSLAVYFIVAFSIGWVPMSLGAIIISTIIFIFVYTLFWIGFNLYYRNMTASLNETLEHHKDETKK